MLGSHRKNLSRFRDIWIGFVISNLDFPWEFAIPFVPLTANQWGPAVVLFIEFDLTYDGIDIGLTDSLSDRFFVQARCPC